MLSVLMLFLIPVGGGIPAGGTDRGRCFYLCFLKAVSFERGKALLETTSPKLPNITDIALNEVHDVIN
jgi:hypothetical protein